MRPWTSHGPPEYPAAVVVHGTGSTPEFLHRCFASALLASGVRLVTYPLRGHCGDPADGEGEAILLASHVEDLAEVVVAVRPTVVGGVSLGAHAAATWAAGADRGSVGLVLCLPAWTGAPDAIAAANATQAAELDRVGLAATLARIADSSVSWVTEEVMASWPTHDRRGLAAALRGIALSPAPSLDELAALDLPTGVVAVSGDALHPAGVAEQWSAAIPGAAMETITVSGWGRDRGRLGTAAVAALIRAGWTPQLSGSR